jgi:hypothetical protein
MIKTIIVKYNFEAIHCWKECPIEEVSFLRTPHRHLFYVTAEKIVSHNERDIEIIMLKREMESYSKSKYNYENESCETIAENLLNKFNLLSCQVLEDNENGAKISL